MPPTKTPAGRRRWYQANKERIRAAERKLFRQDKVYAKKCRTSLNATRARRKVWLNSLKTKPCLDCRRRFPPECMDFDHVRGKKLFCISSSTARDISSARVLREIAKCELVCSNCHRVRTMKRKGRK